MWLLGEEVFLIFIDLHCFQPPEKLPHRGTLSPSRIPKHDHSATKLGQTTPRRRALSTRLETGGSRAVPPLRKALVASVGHVPSVHLSVAELAPAPPSKLLGRDSKTSFPLGTALEVGPKQSDTSHICLFFS